MLTIKSKMRRSEIIASRSFALRAVFVLANLVIVASCAGSEAQFGSRDWNAERRRMVEVQLRARDIRHPRVLDVMRTVPRHLFVPEPERDRAYNDTPLPIGHGQTISQPYIVAFMTQELDIEAGHRVLEIGTGLSGGSARRTSEGSVHHRDRRAVGGAGASDTHEPRLSQRQRPHRQRLPRLA